MTRAAPGSGAPARPARVPRKRPSRGGSANRVAQIGVIGCGRLGTSLARALHAAGLPLVAVADRRPSRARALARRLPRVVALAPKVLAARCTLVVLAVPDDAVAATCAALPFTAATGVVHCSGALTLDALAAAAACGALRGCLHPLQAFPDRSGNPERFAGIHCGVEADRALLRPLVALVRALGATPLSLRGVDRARYHAAAVLASNYVVALHAAAERVWALSGLPAGKARGALLPLTLGAAAALQTRTLEAALTGPLARGDVRTLQRHLRALDAAPELRALYAQLGALLLDRKLGLPAAKRRALRRLLTP